MYRINNLVSVCFSSVCDRDRTTTVTERIRQLSEASASRSRMHVARGRAPRDANAHTPRAASRTCIACSTKSHGRYRFPARFRAHGENSTNKQVARRKQYRAK